LLLLSLLPLCGCRKAQPIVSGGRPIGYWIKASHGPDATARKEAVFKLGNAGPTDPTVLPALIAALKDSDARVRCETILALAKFGPDAKPADDALTEIQSHDPDPKARDYAAKALKKIRGGG